MFGKKRILPLAAAVIIAAGVAVSAAYFFYGRSGSTSVTTTFPASCARPPAGYLIVANADGFNDSIDHGAPAKPWPIVGMQKGSTVTITVCNIDNQAHGFQITHYFDSQIETVAPGQALTVSFVATESGRFTIYCSIFCTVHSFMQSGELVVS